MLFEFDTGIMLECESLSEHTCTFAVTPLAALRLRPAVYAFAKIF